MKIPKGWTDQKPKAEGFYWYVDEVVLKSMDVAILDDPIVACVGPKGDVTFCGTDDVYDDALLTGYWWKQRIEPPENDDQMKTIYGVVQPKPLRGFPPGRRYLFMEKRQFAKVYVYTSTSTRVFLVDAKQKTWWPGPEQQREEWSYGRSTHHVRSNSNSAA